PQGGSLGPPTLQATLNNGVTSWVDYEYVMTEGYTVDLLEYDVRSYYTCGSTSVSADSDFLTVFGEGGLLKISAIANQARAPFAPESYVVSALPNPFNPITTLRYQLRENAHVRLSIYDLHGRLVKTLVKEEKLAGYYSMPWQSIDASGRNTSSGVYFFEFVAIPLNGAAPYRESGKPLLAK
ncbi:MAG: FlgD immunoglobulin-like domain containing protein, partial [bacterium]